MDYCVLQSLLGHKWSSAEKHFFLLCGQTFHNELKIHFHLTQQRRCPTLCVVSLCYPGTVLSALSLCAHRAAVCVRACMHVCTGVTRLTSQYQYIHKQTLILCETMRCCNNPPMCKSAWLLKGMGVSTVIGLLHVRLKHILHAACTNRLTPLLYYVFTQKIVVGCHTGIIQILAYRTFNLVVSKTFQRRKMKLVSKMLSKLKRELTKNMETTQKLRKSNKFPL